MFLVCTLLLALPALLCACATMEPRDVHGDSIDSAEHVGRNTSALTLAELAGTYGCSTEGVQALSQQLLDQMYCLAPNTLARFSHPNIVLTSHRVNPYLLPAGNVQPRDWARGGTSTTQKT